MENAKRFTDTFTVMYNRHSDCLYICTYRTALSCSPLHRYFFPRDKIQPFSRPVFYDQ